MPPPALRAKPPPKPPRRPGPGVLLGVAISVTGFLILAAMAVSLLSDDRWMPWTPLDPNAQPVAATPLKLARATSEAALCRAALEQLSDTTAVVRPDRDDSAECHIRRRFELRALAGATLAPVETRCDTALRLGMWVRHTVQPAARRYFGSPVAELLHLGSYSCRRIRTPSGTGASMSAHATARAIDISGVRLGNGRVVPLLGRWEGGSADAAFWREVRDGACTWFRTVLSPDFNALHADHFHLASGRWGACR